MSQSSHSAVGHPPTKPGYYWAKLKTPSGMPAGEDWASRDWEIVKVWENELGGFDPNNEESLAVWVPGIPVTQWPLDFFWGPMVDATPPK